MTPDETVFVRGQLGAWTLGPSLIIWRALPSRHTLQRLGLGQSGDQQQATSAAPVGVHGGTAFRSTPIVQQPVAGDRAAIRRRTSRSSRQKTATRFFAAELSRSAALLTPTTSPKVRRVDVPDETTVTDPIAQIFQVSSYAYDHEV